MDTEKVLSPQESLQLIANVVSATKENYKNQSVFFILWGILVAAASFGQYALIQFSDIRPSALPWMILMPIGVLLSIYFGKKQSSERKTLTFYNNFLNMMWIVLYVAFFLTIVICLSMKVSPTVFVMLLAGIGTSISGLVMKSKAFIAGGILFAVTAVACTQVDASTQLLLSGVASLLGYVLPNYFLTSKSAENV
jgi:hypothetical protein